MTLSEFHSWEKERLAAVRPILTALLASGHFTESPLECDGILKFDHGKDRDKEIFPRRFDCCAISAAIYLEEHLRDQVREALCDELDINDPGDLAAGPKAKVVVTV